MGGYVGWRVLSDARDAGRGDTPRTRSDGQDQVPPDRDVLHVRSGEERVVDESRAGPYRMIRWEDGGSLTVEPGSSLVMEESRG